MRIAPQIDKCLFCHRKADSGEHLFSDWLKVKFPHSQQRKFTTLSATYEGPLGGEIRETSNVKRPHKGAVNTIKHYVVCKKCNMGWMSRHESRTKPILLPIIEGKTLSLRRGEIRILERWIAKTIAVNEMGYQGGKSVIQSDLRLLKRYGNLKRNWIVWIGMAAHSGRGLATSYNLVAHPGVSADGKHGVGYASCTVLLIGRLVIFALVSANFGFGVNKSTHIASKLRAISPNAQFLDWPPQHDLSDREIELLTKTLVRIFNGPAPPEGGFFRG